ncbi:MAG: hypothetical protein AABZ44_05255 [Elusimicrobiota bacterium]
MLWAQPLGRTNFLTHGPGSFEESMGGAVVAFAQGPNALYYNAAGLASGQSGITGEYAQLFPGVNYSWLGSAFSLGGNSMGIGVINLDLGEITVRQDVLDPGSQAKSYERAYLFGFSRPINGSMQVGSALGLLDFRLASHASKARFIDLGVSGRVASHLTLGAVLKNAYFSGLNLAGNKEVYPQELRTALAVDNGPMALTVQVEKVLDASNPRFSAGLGYALLRFFSLRLGMNGSPRFGVGLLTADRTFALDFAWQMQAITPTARVGLSYFFRDEEDSGQRMPDANSEMKQRASSLKDYLAEEAKRFLENGDSNSAERSLEKLYVLNPASNEVRQTLISLLAKDSVKRLRLDAEQKTYPRIRLFPVALSRAEKERRKLWLFFSVNFAERQVGDYAPLAQEFSKRWPRDPRSVLIRELVPGMLDAASE